MRDYDTKSAVLNNIWTSLVDNLRNLTLINYLSTISIILVLIGMSNNIDSTLFYLVLVVLAVVMLIHVIYKLVTVILFFHKRINHEKISK